jgi:hypothetical protein
MTQTDLTLVGSVHSIPSYEITVSVYLFIAHGVLFIVSLNPEEDDSDWPRVDI